MMPPRMFSVKKNAMQAGAVPVIPREKLREKS